MGPTTEETIALVKACLEAGRGQAAAQLLRDSLREDQGYAALRASLVDTYLVTGEPQQAARYDIVNSARDPEERRKYLGSMPRSTPMLSGLKPTGIVLTSAIIIAGITTLTLLLGFVALVGAGVSAAVLLPLG